MSHVSFNVVFASLFRESSVESVEIFEFFGGVLDEILTLPGCLGVAQIFPFY